MFGDEDVRLAAFSDSAGVLRAKERKQMRLLMNDFEHRFPQLFFAVYIGAFEEVAHLRQFGFWLLNRGAFVDVEVSRPNECGILLTLDVAGKAGVLTYGYGLLPFLDEDVTFHALSAGHPLFLQGMYFRGIEMVMKKIEGALKKRSKRAMKEPMGEEYGAKDERTDELLQRIRSRHRQRVEKI